MYGWHPIASSNIKQIKHDGNNLWVEFAHGGIYMYEDVPVEEFENLKEAPSAGKYFHQNIKENYNGNRSA